MKKIEKLKQFCVAFVLSFICVMIFSGTDVSAKDVTKTIPGKGQQTFTYTDSEIQEVSGGYIWLKFKAGNTGYVTTTFRSKSSLYSQTNGYVSLCNSKKKLITSQCRYLTSTDSKEKVYYTLSFGVKKGSIYYLRIQPSSYLGGIQVGVKFNTVKVNAGTKKSNAKSISAKKVRKGVLTAGGKNVDWYKIKLTKKQKIRISVEVQSNGVYSTDGITLSLYKSNGSRIGSPCKFYRMYPKDVITAYMKNSLTGKTYGMDKGTYYIKMERSSATSTGAYSLSWK